jgi:hypothetical protein
VLYPHVPVTEARRLMVRPVRVSALCTQPFLLSLRRRPIPLRKLIWVNVAAHSAASIRHSGLPDRRPIWRLGGRLRQCVSQTPEDGGRPYGNLATARVTTLGIGHGGALTPSRAVGGRTTTMRFLRSTVAMPLERHLRSFIANPSLAAETV